MPFYGKNSKISTEYVDIYNSWCHFSGDSYFTQNQYTKIVDNGSSLYGLANLSSSDTWRTMANFDFYAATSNSSTITQLSCIAAGAMPTFSYNFYSKTDGDWYSYEMTDLTATSTGLQIGTASYSFRDGVTPRFIIAALQAGGGGAGPGGGAYSLDGNGTGGGGGGFICGVVKLDFANYTYKFRVGSGGGGGSRYDDRVNDYATIDADPGEDTWIKKTSKTNTDSTTTVITATGGGAGVCSSKSAAKAGGTGGSYDYLTSDVFCVATRSGGTGGKVYKLKNATGCAALTAKATANSSYSTLGSGSGLSFYKTWTATSGGAQGNDLSATGGGGASMLSSGAQGGGYMEAGKNGGTGAGGGGGRYVLLGYRDGGNGGDGAIYFWY